MILISCPPYPSKEEALPMLWRVVYRKGRGRATRHGLLVGEVCAGCGVRLVDPIPDRTPPGRTHHQQADRRPLPRLDKCSTEEARLGQLDLRVLCNGFLVVTPSSVISNTKGLAIIRGSATIVHGSQLARSYEQVPELDPRPDAWFLFSSG